jgi:hypothetical protein
MTERTYVTKAGYLVELPVGKRTAWINVYPKQTSDFLWFSEKEALIAAGDLCIATVRIEYGFESEEARK